MGAASQTITGPDRTLASPVLTEAMRSNLEIDSGVEMDIPVPSQRADALTLDLFSDAERGWSLKSVRVWADDCR